MKKRWFIDETDMFDRLVARHFFWTECGAWRFRNRAMWDGGRYTQPEDRRADALDEWAER